jgi:hypothetical protein
MLMVEHFVEKQDYSQKRQIDLTPRNEHVGALPEIVRARRLFVSPSIKAVASPSCLYNTFTMSSPPPAPSSPPQDNYGPDEQLRNEAAASQDFLQPTDNTTQNSSQRPPASSPLFFQSSPAANAGADGMSSPMRAESALPSDGGPTPRASGQTIGGAPASTNHPAEIRTD